MSRTVLSRAVLSRTLSLALYCSVSRNYNQPNMAAAESEGITHCFPGTFMGTLDSTSPIRIKGNFGDERYRFVEVTNILPTCAELMVFGVNVQVNLRSIATSATATTGRVSMLYRSQANGNMWQSLYFTFSPALMQVWEFMFEQHTRIKYGVDGLAPSISLDSRSADTSGLEFANSFLRLGEIDSDDPTAAKFILRSNEVEVTSTYRYVMTVPGMLTALGGTLTAVMYVFLAPLALHCLWKKCSGGSVLDLETKSDKALIDHYDAHMKKDADRLAAAQVEEGASAPTA